MKKYEQMKKKSSLSLFFLFDRSEKLFKLMQMHLVHIQFDLFPIKIHLFLCSSPLLLAKLFEF